MVKSNKKEGVSSKKDSSHLGPIRDFYGRLADEYDGSFLKKGDYQLPRILRETFNKYKIVSGSVLDLGCGTGIVKDALQGKFEFTGVDITPEMAQKALSRGYKEVFNDNIELVLPNFSSKSFDHVIALSSLFLIEDIEPVINQISNIARSSWFITLEYLTPEFIKEIKLKTGIILFDHTNIVIEGLTEDRIEYAYTSPTAGDKINSRILFRKLL